MYERQNYVFTYIFSVLNYSNYKNDEEFVSYSLHMVLIIILDHDNRTDFDFVVVKGVIIKI